MKINKKDKYFFLFEEMEKLNIQSENIIGMLSMLNDDEDKIDELIKYFVNTPNMTEEKVVKALVLVTRK